MNALPPAAALIAALLSPSAFAACYAVYGPDQQVIYRASEPPVDLSRQLHETLPLIAPGSHMVFSLDATGCEVPLNKLPQAGTVGQGAMAATPVPAPRAARADRS